MKRRGERIVTSGLAWPVAMLEDPRQASTAIVEVECDPGQLLATVQHAGHHQAVSSIDLSSGLGDVVMTSRAQDDAELAEFILTHVGGELPGVRSVRTSVLSSTLKIGSKWTLGVLRPAQVERIPRARPPRAAAVKVVPDDLFLDLVAILEKDIRASNLRLSQEPGISAQKAAGSVGTLRMQNVLDFPIHVSQQYSNWPVVTRYFLKVPSQSLLGMAPPWIAMPEIQFAGVAFGQYDLILALTTQCRSDAVRLEAQLVDRIPGAVVLDRSPVIRVHKHLGHILDSSGRGTAEIISMVRR